MTLEAKLLQKLADWRPAGSRDTLRLDDPTAGWCLHLQVDAVDTLGCRLWELYLERTGPAISEPALKEQGQRIARQATGLLEPLSLIEVDADRNIAQLRSQAPAQFGNARLYYELLRQGNGSTRLSRYRTEGSKREQTSFTLTHEALAKLVRDLMA
jgi:hypothetical protein